MNRIKVIAICGKSAAGKDTLLQEILKLNRPDIHEIISCTTRPPREGEVHGKNYYFLSNQDFADKIENGKMLEATVFRDWCYGTSIDSLNPEAINVGVFNMDGIDILLDNPNIDLYVVMVEASDKTRLLRSLQREIYPDVDEIVRRYWADKEDFAYASDVVNFILMNEGQGINPEAAAEMASMIIANAEAFWAKKTN